MKANELMIGDWVYNNPSYFNDDYNGVTEFPDELQSYKIERGEDLEETGCYSPIPLTAEILEKNGFKLREGCTSAWDWGKGEFSVHISGTPDCPIGQTLTIYTPGGTVGAAYSSHRTLSDYKFRGVHVFQHALRLCGLKELADNFKVE